jgi:peptidoglycan/LPS O-acetylase OafA/YrhL
MQRNPQLDGLRGVAILMVFANHAFHAPLMWMGVDLFFVLSGYLITNVLLQLKETRAIGGKYWGPFYFRRLRRIVPPYAAFLLFAGLMFPVAWRHTWYWYVLPGANFPLAFGMTMAAAMTPLWSLAVEEQFYLLWPWFVLATSRQTLRRLAIAIVIVSPILRAVCTPLFSTHFPIYSLTIFRADTLAIGAAVALSTGSSPRYRVLALRSFLLTGVALAAFSFFPSFRTGANSIFFNSVGYSLSAILFGSALVYAVGTCSGLVYRILSTRPLRYLGLISYTFYLYHEAVILKLGACINSQMGIASAAFVVTTAIAAVSWHVMEAPLLRAGSSSRVTGTMLRWSSADSRAIQNGAVETTAPNIPDAGLARNTV